MEDKGNSSLKYKCLDLITNLRLESKILNDSKNGPNFKKAKKEPSCQETQHEYERLNALIKKQKEGVHLDPAQIESVPVRKRPDTILSTPGLTEQLKELEPTV